VGGIPAAAQSLDAVRRAASAAAGEQQAAAAAARQELSVVRARLAPQQARLVRATSAYQKWNSHHTRRKWNSASLAMAGGPTAVLASLQQARRTADAADATIIGPGPGQAARCDRWRATC
jgi:hypothetical protein